jgi:hypothetical protein
MASALRRRSAKPAAFSSPHRISSGNPYLFCNSAQRAETLARASGLKLATHQLNRTDGRLAGCDRPVWTHIKERKKNEQKPAGKHGFRHGDGDEYDRGRHRLAGRLFDHRPDLR